MSDLGNARSSILALRKEAVSGTLIEPNNANQFVPLRSGFSLSREVEELANEELRSGIAEVRGAQGKETVSGELALYLRHSGVEGQVPMGGILYESAFGSVVTNATEYDTAAGTNTTKITVADGTNFYVGQALLIKDGSNGFSIRNIAEISTDDLILNFPLNDSPANGTDLGKAVTFIPLSENFPTFSAWNYVGNGHAKVANSRNEALSISMDFTANQFVNATFSFEGTNYRFNPIEITASSRFVDFNDGGVQAASVAVGFYNNPHELAAALQTAMDAQSTDEITVSYSNVTGKFTIATDGSALSLLWDSGTNAANTIGAKLGFDIAADDTGSLSYEADNAQDYASSITPAYDSADPLIAKDVEFYIGDAENMMCRCATSATIEVTKETEDVDCICEETGTKGKIATQRQVNITAEIILDKHDVSLFKALREQEELQVMLNVGEKSGGNYVAGKCVNFYVPNAGVTSFTTEGENFVVASVSVKGYFDTRGQCFLNFV